MSNTIFLSQIHVVILADRQGIALQPLTDNSCIALLPMVGKTVLIHALEAVSEAGLKNASVVISAQAEAIKQQLGDGKRWGLHLDYVLSQGDESIDSLLPRLPTLTDTTLFLRGDVLHSRILAEFLSQASVEWGNPSFKSDCLYASIADKTVACLCRGSITPAALQYLGNNPPKHDVTAFDGSNYNALDSLKAYHQANLDIVAGRFSTISMAGRDIALGLSAGRHAQVSPKSLKQGCAFVGEESRVHPSAEFVEDVMISPRVIVDKEAIIRNSVILPDTYIGELIELNHAIVQGNQLIRVDTGAVTQITDTFLLADLKTTRLNTVLADSLNRVLGGLLLLLSLPLWLLLFGSKAEKYTLQSNRLEVNELGMRQRRMFETWEYTQRTPILRHLPLLLAVVRGDLRLVGVMPLSPKQASERLESWENVRDSAPSGLIGPTQLLLEPTVPLEEKLLCDAFYARQRGTRKDLEYLWLGVKKLFSTKAWR
ncbi:sugar transferase [Candidatus Halobeggiatoa sp. HSG11]|nr:sugar transferase [Candidatus Halobeggiatoa sp. HSG11]